MYLQHFGLSEPPFKITPATGFFFSGANRGEILDALIYAVTDSEGIIKITGEVGSGKTMLCRMLLERLPPQVEPVYLANPSLSREEMLYAIADGLGLDLEGQRVNVIMQTLQNLLEQKFRDGKRVVVLVDEAHAMPLETLEELRLLYNLQVGDHKLLQIVLFGQPELNVKLEQPNMRQLKDRIVHHFIMLPLSRTAIESYLMFRMRAAGFRGSNIFSAKAIRLIGNASQGLLRRINILADKALLAAFIAEANSIEARHVQEAIRDSGFTSRTPSRATVAMAAGAALILVLAAGAWRLRDAPLAPSAAPLPGHGAAPAAPATPATAAAPAMAIPAASAVAASHVPPQPAVLTAPGEASGARAHAQKVSATAPSSLLQQRLDATRAMLASLDKSSANIQLFYTEDAKPGRMEHFLKHAQELGTLSNIYVLPVKIKGEDAFRVLYGVYPSVQAARAAMSDLPPNYHRAFAPTLYVPEQNGR